MQNATVAKRANGECSVKGMRLSVVDGSVVGYVMRRTSSLQLHLRIRVRIAGGYVC